MMEQRKCFRDPIPEIFEAADLLDQAINFHLTGEYQKAENLITKSNIPIIRDWTESIWGAKSPFIGFKAVPNSELHLEKSQRLKNRMPNKVVKAKLIMRDGYNCVFCGIPVIRKEIRNHIQKLYPNVLEWGKRNIEQHAAFQAMWLQYDHIVPHSRGGGSDLDNLVITCAPCYFGRMEYTLSEVGIVDPRVAIRTKSSWDGLERIAAKI